jgi:PRC-barrel domain protein
VVEYLRVFDHVGFFLAGGSWSTLTEPILRERNLGLVWFRVNNFSRWERNMTKRFQAIAGTVLVGCMVLGGSRSAFCQQRNEARGSGTGVGAKQQAGAPRSSTDILRSSVMIGSSVNFQGGSALGKVTDFVINDGGCVQYVVVSYQNRFVPVPWMATMYNSADRSLMLGIDQAQLGQLPTFGQYSELSNAQFGQKVNTFFKVNSRTSEQRANKPVSDDQSSASKQGAQTENQGQKPGAGTNPSADNKPQGEKRSAAAAEKQAAPRKTHG